MKRLALLAIACLLSAGPLLAQDPLVAAQSVDLGTGTDSTIDPLPPIGSVETGAPTNPAEAEALDQSLYGDGQAMDDAPAEPAVQGRPWKINFHASAGIRHDDNIFGASADKRSDIVTTLTAGGGITLGDYTLRENNYLIADYTGIGEIFGRYAGEDAFEQLASIETQILLAHFTLHGAFHFQDLADENIDTNSRTRRQIYSFIGSARYDISDKTYLEATTQVTIANYDLYLDSNDERGGISFDYLPNPNVTTGIGVMAGVLNVQDSSSQTYEQLLASVQFDTTSKITLNASAGVEDRQASGANALVTPVFNLNADYKPIEGLDVTLTAFRQVENSAYYASSDYVSTGVDGGVQFELSSRFTLLLDAGYAHAGYRSVSRTDDYFSIRPALRYTASSYCNIELYYSFRDNNSTLRTSAFDDTQFGITANLTY